MQFRWDLWNFFKEYILRIVLVWLALLSAFSIAVHLLIKFWLGKDIPIEYWIILVVAGIIIAQSIVYYRIARRQIPGERIESDLKSVSDLRIEGVNKLQNIDKNTIRTVEDFKKFNRKFENWRKRVVSEIEKVSPSQASIFQVLGIVQYRAFIKGYQGEVKEDLEKMLGIIADYTARIKEFVDRFSIENLANRVKK